MLYSCVSSLGSIIVKHATAHEKRHEEKHVPQRECMPEALKSKRPQHNKCTCTARERFVSTRLVMACVLTAVARGAGSGVRGSEEIC